MTEVWKAVLFGIVEGITEWLPISSTGHMILLEEFVKLEESEAFLDMFRVVIQLGAILAVIKIFWKEALPLSFGRVIKLEREKISTWIKIFVACIPAAVVGIMWEEWFTSLFYNYYTVALALIVFGILFIFIETKNKNREPRVRSLQELTYQDAFLIGIFQLIAAIFPGTSRSGATIVGGLFLGVSRTAAAEFTFFLAITVMAGASILKIAKYGLSFSAEEIFMLLTAMVTAFLVSVLVIRFLMDYIKSHNFKVFGWYRIFLGMGVLAYFIVM